ESLQGRPNAAIGVAERALVLADELGLEPPARALGFRGHARSSLGDGGGIADMREAIRLATQAGQGRDVALLHNNLGVNLLAFEGPQAALAELKTGIAYATARGLTEAADFTTGSTLSPLHDAGQLDDALTVATALAERIHDEQSALI